MPPRRRFFAAPLAMAAAAALLTSGCVQQRASENGPAAAAQSTGTSSPAAGEAAAAARFTDVATKAGIDFRYAIAGKRPINILQAMGGGCAFLDVNGDGSLDILLISQRVALYQGDGKGGFTDVTEAAGLASLPAGWWMGCAVGDYDNDGFDDLYLSAYRGGVLLHNEGGKAFRDVTKQAGIAPQPWGTACTFGDYDNDGRLDLYIGNYVKFGPDSVQLCKVKDFLTSCSPTVYEAEKGALYRNLGKGRFQDVTRETGADDVTGKALGAVFFDADGTGRQSLMLPNDEVPSDLLWNTDGSHFKNIGEIAGVAYTESGKPYGGMGVDRGDVDGDGRLDIAIGTFTLENRLVLINQGSRLFVDQSEPLGVAGPAMSYLTFGTKFLDFDNDGDLDIMFANGYIADNVAKYEPARAYREPTLLLRNEDGKQFTDLSKQAGPDLQREIVGRGLATGDYDNDGRVDVIIADGEGPPLLLHNETSSPGNYLSLRLIGTKSNRNGYGATVTIEAGGKRQTRACHADGSYLSSSDSRVHVGIGSAESARITVRWPAGGASVVQADTVNRTLTVREEAR